MEDARDSLLPTFAPSSLGPMPEWASNLDAGSVIAVIFALIFIWWFIFSLVAAYHWLRFGRESWIAVPVLALHVAVSGWLFLFLTSGLH